MTMPCKEINRTVPYFKEQDRYGKAKYNESMNEYIDRQFSHLAKQPIDLVDKAKVIEGLDEIPDGTLQVSSANKNKFDYQIQINDVSYF